MTPAINFLDFFSPNKVGMVFIWAARSPSKSLISLKFETMAWKIKIVTIRPNGKAVITLLGLIRKNPPNITDTQTKLTRLEFNKTNLFRRKGGLE